MIELCVFRSDDDYDLNYPDSMYSIQDYMIDEPNWVPALEKTLLIFDALREDQNMEINKFGLLDFLVPQLKEVIVQLRSGKDALLRTAGDYGARFFLFELKNSKVYFSILGIFPDPLKTYYPLTNSPVYTTDEVDQKAELYTYLEQNKETLKRDSDCSLLAKTVHEIPMDAMNTIENLEQQVVWGEALLDKIYNRG